MNMSALINELKELLIQSLELEDIAPEDIDPQAALFGDGLGLDSIDALELGMAVQKKYGIKLDATNEETREHFYSVQNLARFIEAERA